MQNNVFCLISTHAPFMVGHIFEWICVILENGFQAYWKETIKENKARQKNTKHAITSRI